MSSYDNIRQKYRPQHIKVLLIAESPPPESSVESSRHFYRTDKVRSGDRLFVNTVKAIYPESKNLPDQELEQNKEQWLKRLQSDGFYMIEALQKSLPHEITKKQRQELIGRELPSLMQRVGELATKDTKIVLIKSNVFEVAAGPLREAGFSVLNKALIDYPGHYNQQAYRDKLAGALIRNKGGAGA